MTPAPSTPADILIGAATAGHQVEGGNVNSDCWVMEHAPASTFAEPSGDAVDFYHRCLDDVALAARLGLTAFRFSVEWSRVEPEPGWFSRAALDHYRRLAAACKEAGLATVVTFNHWTTPIWFAADGGWESPDSVDRFTRYVDRVAAHLKQEIDWAVTLNEPNVATVVMLGGEPVAPPRGDRRRSTEEATRRHSREGRRFRPMMFWPGDQLAGYSAAHRAARVAIKAQADVPVGWSLACEDYQAVPGGHDRWAEVRQRAIIDWLEVSREDDFVGVQNYTRRLVGESGVIPPPDGAEVSDSGWELHPESLTNACRLAAEVSGRPVMVTEHGLATNDDAARLRFTRDALVHLGRAQAEGLDLRGYLHWTFLDEFEWSLGYGVTFGLVEVDRQTFVRRPRPSAEWLGRLAASGSLSAEHLGQESSGTGAAGR